MQKMSILFALSLAAVALAGCASNDGTEGATVDTPSVTPAASPTPEATPEPSPEVLPTPEPIEEMPPAFALPDCPESATTTDAPGEKSGYPELVFTVQEPAQDDECFHFVGPATASAGWTVVTLQNNGMAPHIMPMFRLADGKTLEDFEVALEAEMQASMAGEETEEPEWLVPAGGVGVATPFSSGSVVMNLEEGRYVMVCFFGGHFMQGMYRELVVEPAEGEPLAEPTADLTIAMVDFGFEIPANITPGTYVVKFVNNGAQPHEAPLIRLNEGATMEQFLEAIEGGAGGPPPGAGIGGVNEIAPGGYAYGLVTFTAGDYGLVCFVSSDEHDGAPHLALGMVAQFTVAELVDVDDHADDGHTHDDDAATNDTSGNATA